MDTRISKLVARQTPKMNPVIANSIVNEHMRGTLHYVEKLLQSAARSYPPELEFVSISRCTPEEQFRVVTNRYNTKPTYELAKSDVFLTKIILRLHGKTLPPRYLYLPFVREAGQISLLGPTFCISPVLADPVFSVTRDGAFLQLPRSKLTFKRLFQVIKVNRETRHVPLTYSEIYNYNSKRAKRTGNVEGNRISVEATTTLPHYLFGKYGLTETFRHFGHTRVVFGYEDTINEKQYPADEWVICESVGLAPKGYKGPRYHPTHIRLAIPSKDFSIVNEALIAGFFYVADRYPERVIPEYIENNETTIWRVLLGHAIFNNNSSEGKLLEDINSHYNSIDDYVDLTAQTALEDEGIDCQDIYSLFIHIITNLPGWLVHTDTSSMYDKHLMVLTYVLSDIREAIFKATWRITSNTRKVLTERDVTGAFDMNLKMETILRLKSHGEVSNITSPGDNKVFKMTSHVVLQTDATNNKASKGKTSLADPSKLLHASISKVGSYLNLPKSDPTGRSKLNLYLKLDPYGRVMQDPEDREEYEALQARFRRFDATTPLDNDEQEEIDV